MQILPQNYQNQVSIQERGVYGIDKIKLCLNSATLNLQLLKRVPWHYDSHGRTKLHALQHNHFLLIEKVSCCYMFIINQEYFAPNGNILEQTLFALHLLALEGFIPIQPDLRLYMGCIHHITELELYFSLKSQHFKIKENRSFQTLQKAKEEEGFFQYNGTETLYSYNGVSDNSSVCLYNKREKDFHDQSFSKSQIMSFPYPYRLEFRLRGKDIADLSLLDAPLKTVFTNFLPTLAFLHNKFVKQNVDMNIPMRSKYNRVLSKSKQVTCQRNRTRTNGTSAKKSRYRNS